MASTTLTAEQRRIRARIGAFALHAQGGTTTTAATTAFLSRFEREVVEAATSRGETLEPDEIARRATLARKAHMSRLALASSRARSKKAGSEISSPDPATEHDDGPVELPPAA